MGKHSEFAGRDMNFDCSLASICQEVIPLTKAAGIGREGVIVKRTKAGKPRVVELDVATVSALRLWKARQAEERLAMGAGYADLDLVFARPDGRPYHPEAFPKTFVRRLRQAKFSELPRIRVHDLRHTWATLALVAGVDVKVTARPLVADGYLADVPACGQGDAVRCCRACRCTHLRRLARTLPASPPLLEQLWNGGLHFMPSPTAPQACDLQERCRRQARGGGARTLIESVPAHTGHHELAAQSGFPATGRPLRGSPYLVIAVHV